MTSIPYSQQIGYIGQFTDCHCKQNREQTDSLPVRSVFTKAIVLSQNILYRFKQDRIEASAV